MLVLKGHLWWARQDWHVPGGKITGRNYLVLSLEMGENVPVLEGWSCRSSCDSSGFFSPILDVCPYSSVRIIISCSYSFLGKEKWEIHNVMPPWLQIDTTPSWSCMLLLQVGVGEQVFQVTSFLFFNRNVNSFCSFCAVDTCTSW